MDRMLYLAMNGAKQVVQAQAINAHNLANVSTTGFRAELDALRSQPLHGPGFASRVYAVAEHQGTDLSPGAVTHTGRELDIAVDGEGWIAVQAADGSEAYTRAGNLKVNTVGQLLTSTGEPVLGNNGPIAMPPFEKLEIGSDGTLSVQPVGQNPATLAVVDRIKLVNPPAEQLIKGADGLMRLRSAAAAQADAAVKVIPGALEGSNVNAVAALVDMIALARDYEAHVKLMTAVKEADEQSVQLMRVS